MAQPSHITQDIIILYYYSIYGCKWHYQIRCNLDVVIKLDTDTEVKDQLFCDNIKTLKIKETYCLMETMKNPYT